MPDLSCQALAQERFSSCWEHWEACEFGRSSKVGSARNIWSVVLFTTCIGILIRWHRIWLGIFSQRKLLSLCHLLVWEVLYWGWILRHLLYLLCGFWEWLGQTLCHWWLTLICLCFFRHTPNHFSRAALLRTWTLFL